MDWKNIIDIEPLRIDGPYPDELHLLMRAENFNPACLALHKKLRSTIMMLFATDERKAKGSFLLTAIFFGAELKKWVFVSREIDGKSPAFDSLSREIYSANLFEREIKEMFGIDPVGNPDDRRLRLHEEVWPEGSYPLRKDFTGAAKELEERHYRFAKVEGEGIFEVPVGPVHAGIIGPGHFHFAAAGEPIINLDIRLGFTHRGAEKLFEGRLPEDALALSECIAGDAAFAHSLSFCRALEKIHNIAVPERALYIRAVLLELERLYNHAAGIGGIAIDVGFSAAAAYASLVKEAVHALNEKLTGHRFLKGINLIGGVKKDLSPAEKEVVLSSLELIMKDLAGIKEMLHANGSFMDRVDSTGVLPKKIAEDLGVIGPAGRASGIALDLRRNTQPYAALNFKPALRSLGDVLSRLNIRFDESEASARLIRELLNKMPAGDISAVSNRRSGGALGAAEGWLGPVLYWVKLDGSGKIDRCKIVDPSFHNWPGLAAAAQNNIIPDFPVCNKSFDLSYGGNDL